jgi:hypothetical protein
VIRTLALVGVVACGGGVDSAVVDLSQESQANLCEGFLADFCADPVNAAACSNSCISSACPEAAARGEITSACDVDSSGDDITVGRIEACGEGDTASCTDSGDCMLDALASVCGT